MKNENKITNPKEGKVLKAYYEYFIKNIVSGEIKNIPTKTSVKEFIGTLKDSKNWKLFKGYEQKFEFVSKTYSSLRIR